MLIKDRLTVRQFTLLTFLTMVGDMILIYPSLVTAYGRQDAWLCSLLSQPIGILIIWILFKLHRTHPDLSLIEICKNCLVHGSVLFWLPATCSISSWAPRYVSVRWGLYDNTDLSSNPIRVILTLFLIPIVWGLYMG